MAEYAETPPEALRTVQREDRPLAEPSAGLTPHVVDEADNATGQATDEPWEPEERRRCGAGRPKVGREEQERQGNRRDNEHDDATGGPKSGATMLLYHERVGVTRAQLANLVIGEVLQSGVVVLVHVDAVMHE